MAKKIPDDLAAAFAALGTEFQPWGPRIVITQRDVDTFTDLTGDDNEIHVLRPGFKTVVPGLMTLAYLPKLLPGGIPLSRPELTTINKGFSSVEFHRPVHTGVIIRMRFKTLSLEPGRFGAEAKFVFEISYEHDVVHMKEAVTGIITLLFVPQKEAGK